MIDPVNPRPKVSILIPVFRREKFIAECIQSALDQDFDDFEVIVVDNASDDGTWEICRKFVALDQRVRIFRNEANIGPVRNWIRCAQEARGEFSKILFSDDCLESDCLGTMVSRIDSPEVGLVYCAARIGASREQSVVFFSQNDSTRLTSAEFINLVLCNKAPLSPGAILIRTKDLIENLRIGFPTATPRQFERNGAGPDVMISLLTACDYSYIANVAKPLVFFRAHAGSFTVENADDNISKGYLSAISYFLINHYTRGVLINYLSHGWMQKMLRKRSWIDPVCYLIEYEGRGTWRELVTLCYFASVNMLNKLLSRPYRFLK